MVRVRKRLKKRNKLKKRPIKRKTIELKDSNLSVTPIESLGNITKKNDSDTEKYKAEKEVRLGADSQKSDDDKLANEQADSKRGIVYNVF